ncbi:uncharacterized protein RJT20DRAFT_10584 [Scheffersomyces xylosifermentans]|uniref:uncharacterized protein n=1 Tax=Scheffersomyces xylosifermentans TaxID=1304137 RepID=UPI00315DE463
MSDNNIVQHEASDDDIDLSSVIANSLSALTEGDKLSVQNHNIDHTHSGEEHRSQHLQQFDTHTPDNVRYDHNEHNEQVQPDEQVNNESHEDHDDLDLENAIGNVFDSFDFGSLENNHEHETNSEDHRELNQTNVSEDKEEPNIRNTGAQNELGTDESEQMHQEHHDPLDNIEMALDTSIKNDAEQGPQEQDHSLRQVHDNGNLNAEDIVEENIVEAKTQKDDQSPVGTAHIETETRKTQDDDINLSAAIGNAFKSFTESSTDNGHSDSQQVSIEEQNHLNELQVESNQREYVNNNEPDLNLNNAIKEAFKDIEEGSQSHIKVDQSTRSAVLRSEEQRAIADDDEDNLDLDNAIGDAFKKAFGDKEPSKEDNVTIQNKEETIMQGEDTITISKGTNDTNKSHLDDVIGNALKDIFPENVHHNIHEDALPVSGEDAESNHTEQGQHVQHEKTSTYHDDDDIDLEAAIGNAFANIMTPGTKQGDGTLNDGSEVPTEVQVEKSPIQVERRDDQGDTDEKDLEAAIGDVFKNLAPSAHVHFQDSPNAIAKVIHDDSDAALEDAIGSAFQSITERLPRSELPLRSHVESTQEKEVTEDDLSAIISSTFHKVIGNEEAVVPSSSSHEEKHVGDTSMEEAITEAFKSANKESPQSTMQSEKSKPNREPMDLSNLVQTIVHQMSTQDDSELHTDKLPVPENVIQELALEITHQVQDYLTEEDSEKKTKVTGLPQIDENVFAHFQNEAHREQFGGSSKSRKLEESSDPSLQSALANAVRNVIATGSSATQEKLNHDDKEADLEQLQMNDILQNAFNMAMEHPQELLSDLDMEEDGASRNQVSARSQQSDTLPNQMPIQRLTRQISTSTATFLDSLNRSNDITLSSDSKSKDKTTESEAVRQVMPPSKANADSKSKALSIAETLALHRNSMLSRTSRDYASIESIDDVTTKERAKSLVQGGLNTQLSNVISSITSRIGSGPSETDLLSVIRHMTNAYSSSSLFQGSLLSRGVPSPSEIISSYKTKEDRNSMVNSLSLAKQYLQGQSSADNAQAALLIDNVIHQFNDSEIDPSLAGSSAGSSSALPEIKSEFIASISNSIVSAISNFSPTSHFSRTTLSQTEKIRMDSPEYKEKIRIDNRERKKKWREENAERNKDNDLRSRVLKRAAAMFGEKDTPEKKAWADEEFNRRREKRISKKRKNDSKPHSEESSSEKTAIVTEKDSNVYLQDQNLVRPVTDIFNILSSTTQRENPGVALAATAAATATAAAIYANKNSNANLKQVDSAVSSILSKLMSNATAAGQQERMASLSRGVSSSFKLDSSPPLQTSQPSLPSRLPDAELSSLVKTGSGSTSGILSRLSATIKGLTSNSSLPGTLLDFSNLNLQDKRRADTTLLGDSKRPKVGSFLDGNEKDSISKIVSNLDQIRNSIASSSSSHIWNSTSALKMPQYKKREVGDVDTKPPRSSQAKSEYPALSLPTASPFISNKVHMGININSPATISGLRKPGSFQKPDHGKARSMGFPRLPTALSKQK